MSIETTKLTNVVTPITSNKTHCLAPNNTVKEKLENVDVANF